MRWAAPSDGSAPKVLPLALRGLLLLNPLMGVWYALAFRYRDRLPTWGVVMDGWTAFAELACGLTVATAWFVLLAFVSTII